MNERNIFIEALDKANTAEQAAYLDQACGNDFHLRRRVEALIRAHVTAGSFLEQPAAGLAVTIAGAAEKSVEDSLDPTPLHILTPSQKPGCLGTLGSYEVVEIIGRGGNGLVLRAYDPKLNRIVAIKAMLPELAANPMAVKRFLREARAAAAISHDHVVTIHAIEETNRPPFIVMEFISGQSLQQKIERTGSLGLKEILRIGMQTASGLAAAHAQGLVHRDIKPANVLLENGVERVRLTDFGLARAVDDVGITQTGQITGTPSFMSPEQALGQPIDHRSDLFSLGGVLYTMCTGRPPYRADTAIATLRRVCDDTPRPIREVNPDIPTWLCSVIDRLMAKRSADRYQSAQEVAELLAQCLAHLQQPSTVPLPSNIVAASYAFQSVPRTNNLIGSSNLPVIRTASGMFPLVFVGLLLALTFIGLVVMVATLPTVKLEGIESSTTARIILIALIVGIALFIAAVPLTMSVRRAIREWKYAQRTGDWAPGWIIRCMTCGTSRPLSQLGWVRIGAYGRKLKRVSCSTCDRWSIAEIVRTSDPAFEDIEPAYGSKKPAKISNDTNDTNDTEPSWLGRVPWAAWIGVVPFAVIYFVACGELQKQIDPTIARSLAVIALSISTYYLAIYGAIAGVMRIVQGPRKSLEPQPWRIVMFFALLWFFTTLFVVNWVKDPHATLKSFFNRQGERSQMDWNDGAAGVHK